MNTLNLKKQTEKLGENITNLLSEGSINQIAKDIGFVKRDAGKFDGFKFLDMLLFTDFNHKELSLNSMALSFQERYGIILSKQAVDWRFSDLSVKFFKAVFEKAIGITIEKNNRIDFTEFEKVRIKDSTSFELPENMKDKYPKSIKNVKTALVRIQLEYDIKNGEILDLSLHPFKEQDISDASQTIDDIGTNELVMRDLGYIRIDVLRKIEEKESFYLNRLSFSTNIYEKKNNEFIQIDLGKVYKQMRAKNSFRIEKQVYIGKKEKFKTRIIIECLPESEYEKRIVKAKRTASRRGRNLSDEFKAQQGLNVFITNTKIPANQIRLLYTLRWQIELMFKIWKSIGEINKVKKMKVERFETFLFAKLIWIVVNWQIMRRILIFFFNEKKVYISPYKLFTTFKARIMKFRITLLQGVENLIEYIEEIFELSPYYHSSEKKKNSVTWSYDVIKTF